MLVGELEGLPRYVQPGKARRCYREVQRAKSKLSLVYCARGQLENIRNMSPTDLSGDLGEIPGKE